MNFYKRVDIVDATAKYGFKQTALVAREHFKKGERVYQCLDNCDYTAMGDGEIGWTRLTYIFLICFDLIKFLMLIKG